jgi:predicted RNA methylase
LKKEMVYVGALERKQEVFIKRQRNHDLIFVNHVKSDVGLKDLRVAEVVLKCPVFGRYKISQRQLQSLADALQEVGPRRLVVQVAGKVFDRRDISRWLEKELAARDYQFDPEIEDEVWMFCIDEAYYFGIPIAKARHTDGRDERSEERHGSLPPTIAAALAFSGQPRDEDVILDPVCGSGTLLAEAAAYATGAQLLGVDIDPEAVVIAKANLAQLTSLKLYRGDSRELKALAGFENSDISLMLANLPFGVQFGDKKTNAELYRQILESALAQATPGRFRAVLFTSDVDSLRTALSGFLNFETQDLFRVKVRGELATAVLIKRKSK